MTYGRKLFNPRILRLYISVRLILLTILLISCGSMNNPKPRLSMFVGVDISGSFMNSQYYEDSIEFLAHYLYGHLNGLGDMEVPNELFVGSIGGSKADEAKTFYPIQLFENKSIEEIKVKLHEIFPEVSNAFTDYNAFFDQIALTVKNRNLLMKPISVVMLTDGIPDVKKDGKTDFTSIVVKPLERLARSVTIRLLYTSAVVGLDWQTKVKRRRVKVWTQDAEVMVSWKDEDILLAQQPFEQQDTFFGWVKENVDFGVRARRVD